MEERVGTDHTNCPTLFRKQSLCDILTHVLAMGLTCVLAVGIAQILSVNESLSQKLKIFKHGRTLHFRS